MDVNQNLIITKSDINNNTQLSLQQSSNKLHTSSTTSTIIKPADIDLNLIKKSNTTNTLNSQTNPKQFSNNEISFTNTLNDNLNENNNSDKESDIDATSPLKNKSLPHEIENKTIRKSRGKNIFKTLFCCFSSSHRGQLKNQKSGLVNQTNTNHNAQGHISNNNNINNNNNNNNINNNNNNNSNNNSNNLPISNFYTNDNKENVTNDKNSYLVNVTNIDSKKLNNITNNNNNNNINNNNNKFTHDSNNLSIPHIEEISSQFEEKNLLPPIHPSDAHKKCLIIDLDETLVHSSFKQVYNADFVVPVEIDGTVHQVYVLKRPYVDEFLKRMGELYECVLFTYADPVADLLDKWGVFKARLFREACVFYKGNYVKDLSRLGRDLNSVIIFDNSPASYMFHPENAVPCTSWFDDMHDTELYNLIPFFEHLASVDSVYSILKQSNQNQQSQQFITNQTSSSYLQAQQIDNQQVPSGIQSIIYQQQQNVENRNSGQSTNLNYILNENKILLSIDMMMATKQQQLQQMQQQINNSAK